MADNGNKHIERKTNWWVEDDDLKDQSKMCHHFVKAVDDLGWDATASRFLSFIGLSEAAKRLDKRNSVGTYFAYLVREQKWREVSDDDEKKAVRLLKKWAKEGFFYEMFVNKVADGWRPDQTYQIRGRVGVSDLMDEDVQQDADGTTPGDLIRKDDEMRDVVEFDDGKKLYLPVSLAEVFLPQVSLGADTEIYQARNGNLRLIVQRGFLYNRDTDETEICEIPYGAFARHVLYYLLSNAREGKRHVYLGKNLRDFSNRCGIRYDARNNKKMRQQLKNVAAARFFIRTGSEDYGYGTRILNVGTAIEYWPITDQRGHVWIDRLTISDDFIAIAKNTPIPYRQDHLSQLGLSSMALDLYIWLCFRASKIKPGKMIFISMEDVREFLVNHLDDDKHIKQHIRRAIKKVRKVYPGFKLYFNENNALVVESARRVT